MHIFALDTCFRACSAAVLREDGRLFARFEAMERGHAEALLPMADVVVREAGLAWSSIGRIAATVGPGTFTGLRIGVAAARALALATGADLFGQTSLALLAAGAVQRARTPPDAVLAAAAAGRGHAYVQLFDGIPRAAADARLLPEGELAAVLSPDARRVLTCGSAATRAAGLLAAARRSRTVDVDAHEPDAAVLARMAAGGNWPSLPVQPLYLREPDARPQPDMALARRP